MSLGCVGNRFFGLFKRIRMLRRVKRVQIGQKCKKGIE